MVRKILWAALLAALAPVAAAQVSVLGGGLARDCYEAAKFSQGRLMDAEALCTRALETELLNTTNRAATFTNRGILRMRLGRLDTALSDYAASKRIAPQNGATWLNEGAAYILKQDYEAARASLERSIELGTKDLFAAYYNRAIVKEQTGDIEGAYFDFLKSQELNPDFARTAEQLARFEVTIN
jgi:tetratricopeptide (TPR) repeat protein